MKNSCLIIVFNHRYDNNLNKLKKLYSNRFSDIFVLMPFYDSPHIDGLHIIPVFCSSFCFNGHIAQAYQYIISYNPEGYKYYCIIGDDLILNPNIREDNVDQFLGLGEESSYIKKLCKINTSNGLGIKRLVHGVIEPFCKYNGTEFKKEILSKEDAFDICNSKYGYSDTHFSLKWLCNQLLFNMPLKALPRIPILLNGLFTNKGLALPYPLYKIFSDFIVINGNDFQKVCHMFGVFSAMGLFVEVAIPTTMSVCCHDIVTESDNNKHGIELWGAPKRDAFEREYDLKLEHLFDNWNAETIYYHPIKLSKWQY